MTFRTCKSLLLTFLLFLPARYLAAEEAAPVKNVLFIIADDLRASVLGCYGDKFCKTPNIDRLAKSGLLFKNAYCQGTWCAPSRQSLMHSRYEDSQGPNMGEHFINNGWYSARVGKIYHMRVPGDIIAGTNGKDIASTWTERFNAPGKEAHTPGDYACLNLNIFTRSQYDRQSTKMPHRPFVSVICDSDGSDQPDYKAATKAIELLRKRRNEKFFLAVGLVRPHYPMVAPREYFDAYPHEQMELPPQIVGDTEDIPKQGRGGTNNANNQIGKYPENQKRMWSAYYASVAFMDAQVGRILDTVDELGLRDSTAIVFTSDHGYHLGDHGLWQKSNLHEQVIRVPLVMSVPGMTQGKHTNAVSELVDIYPTACELTGLAIPENVQGMSLVPILRSPDQQVRSEALSLNRGGYSLRHPRMHYIEYPNGDAELYDTRSDPHEITNLANEAEHAELVRDMKSRLESKLVIFGISTANK